MYGRDWKFNLKESSTRSTHALNNNQAVARIDCAARASLTMYVRVHVRVCACVCVIKAGEVYTNVISPY